MKKLISFVIFAILLSGIASSQNNEFKKGLWDNWSVSANVGNSQYFGEVSGNLLDHGTAWAMGLWMNKKLFPALGIRGQLIYGKIKGRADEYSNGNPAYLSFNAKYIEATLNSVLYINTLFAGYNSQRKIEIYVFGGIGLCNLQGKTVDFKKNITLRSFGHGHGSGLNGWEINGMADAGAGLQFYLSKSFALTAETSLRLLNTDNLDGFSGGIKWDFYSYNSLGLIYNFGSCKKTKKEPIYEIPVIKKEVETKPEEKNIESPIEESKIEKKVEQVNTEQPKIEVKPEPVPISIPEVLQNEYRIQILASKTPANTEKLKKHLGITQPINEEYDNQWYRYTIGSYNDYTKAFEEVKKVRNMIYDAFVVMYSRGKRIGPVRRSWLIPEKQKESDVSKIKTQQTNILTEKGRLQTSNEDKYYAVQVIALRKPMTNPASFKKKYKLNYDLYEINRNNFYGYYVGKETDYNEALKLRAKIHKLGIKDAFVISIKESKQSVVK